MRNPLRDSWLAHALSALQCLWYAKRALQCECDDLRHQNRMLQVQDQVNSTIIRQQREALESFASAYRARYAEDEVIARRLTVSRNESGDRRDDA